MTEKPSDAVCACGYHRPGWIRGLRCVQCGAEMKQRAMTGGESEGLKSCPFCEGPAFVVRDPGPPSVLYRVQCRVCGASRGGVTGRCEALAAWNRRASSSEPGREGAWIGELRRAYDRLPKGEWFAQGDHYYVGISPAFQAEGDVLPGHNKMAMCATGNHAPHLALACALLLRHTPEILAALSTPAAPASTPKDVVRLVIAAREVQDEEGSADSLRELDNAAEAFASRVPWEDEPDEPSVDMAPPPASTPLPVGEALRAENEKLRLLILGGEDAPGLAASLTFEEVERAHLENLAFRAATAPETEVLWDIAAERRCQIEVHRWTPAHDDEHTHGEIASAASDYALPGQSPMSNSWAYGSKVADKEPRRLQLVKAGALIVAEIERLDRAALAQSPAPPAEGA